MHWPFSSANDVAPDSDANAVILDPALKKLGGHHYNAAARLKYEFSARGFECRILGSRRADERVRTQLGVHSCFSRSVYLRQDWNEWEFRRHVSHTTRELVRWLGRGRKAPGLFVLPTCDQVLAQSIADYLGTYRRANLPTLLVWLLFAPHFNKPFDAAENAPLLREYRDAFADLKSLYQDRGKLRVLCETPQMAKCYAEALGLDVGVAPGPSLVTPYDRPPRKRLTVDPTIVCMGHANRPKGYRLLPDAIKQVLETYPRARFLVHGVTAGSDAEEDGPLFARLEHSSRQVVVSQRVLEHREYVNWMLQADLLLLPYDPAVYRTRGSGVFFEAQTLGIPVVTTFGCGFAQRAFAHGNAVPIVEHSANGVASAILTALSNLESLRSAAQEVADRDYMKSIIDSVVGDDAPLSFGAAASAAY